MYDLIIVGSGVAGLGAAIYARRFEMKVLVIGDLEGGTITLTHLVENYPGFESLSGLELAQNILKHAKKLGAEIKSAAVTKVEKTKNGFLVKTANEEFESKTVIFATGTEHRKLEAKGAAEFENKGVSYCATCDAPFFKTKNVALVGGSDSAVKESLIAAQHATKVTILYRGEKLRAEPINIRRMEAAENIETKCCVNIEKIYGNEKVEGVKLDNGEDLKLDGIFIEIGRLPRNEIAKDLGVELNEKGEIKITRFAETNVTGVFAAGDVTDADWKQAVTGVAEGAHAANQAFEYLQK
ncbi:FAD-dependent oxidoreductase [Candidatus Gracilibacteria bacterium]|nr:FAD-dependent oxidoreductase [Candidatus Gracilibacteria bacterium]MCF7856704.1 FAD-dependent oxidoreductase [Candidatus Gracilibacteria bacterium]MCF7896984.1 FAD-dependent oxidoreductase [Candidatus Gracilibacteria bacterium]